MTNAEMDEIKRYSSNFDCPVKAEEESVTNKFCDRVCDEFQNDCPFKEMAHRLKVYEDLGFEPHEIAHMAQFYKEQTSTLAITANMKIAGMLCELERYKSLEEQGGLVILPCKVGDVVYKIWYKKMPSWCRLSRLI